MKRNLVDILICPECGSKLNLNTFTQGANGEIVDGVLICSENKHWYPVISGIPRIFVGSYRDIVYKQHSDYFNKYNANLNKLVTISAEECQSTQFEAELKRAARSFGFEWTKFFDYPLDNLKGLLQPHSLSTFEGKLGLDAGCGGGRHVVECAKRAAAIVGVDLSEAVEEAYRKSHDLKNVHIVQADIFRLPFKENTFDFIYSLGTLHHLPAPRRSFDCLVDLLKTKGEIFIWVYKKSFRKIILNPVRKITSRLPLRILFCITSIISFMGYFGIVVPSRGLIKRFPVFAKIIPSHIHSYTKYNFKIYRTDWFDRLSAPIAYNYLPKEIKRWFKAGKLSEIKIKTIGDFWCYGYGRKQADAEPEIQQGNKILVIDVSGIGDVVMSTPSLRALRKKYPESYIGALVSSRSAPLLERCPYINEVFKFDIENFKISKSALNIFKTVNSLRIILKLRSKRFNIAVNLYQIATFLGSLRMRFLFKAINSELSVGRDTDGRGKFYRLRLRESAVDTQHEVEKKLRVVGLLGAAVENKELELWPDSDEETYVLKLLEQAAIKESDFLVGINPNALQKLKLWPEDRVAELADTIMERYNAKTIFFGSRCDEARVNRIMSYMRNSPINLTGKLTLKQYANLIRKIKLFITLDSGPMHIAAAFKIPTIALFGAGQPLRFGPYLNEKAVTLQKAGYAAEAITVDDVLNLFEKLRKNL